MKDKLKVIIDKYKELRLGDNSSDNLLDDILEELEDSIEYCKDCKGCGDKINSKCW